jgi:LPS sulfotransferase NodH
MVKFVLLGHKRCGSTLLSASLSCHRNVFMFGEVFNESIEERQRAYRVGLKNSQAARRQKITAQNYYREGDAANFLKQSVYYKNYWNPVAVGFKMFYEHCRDDVGMRQAWSYLIAEKDIRVIHLFRLNLLETFLSLTLAKQTNEWARHKGAGRSSRPTRPEPVYLSPKDCEDYFRKLAAEQEEARRNFCGHQMLELTYENNICKRYQETFDLICDFLAVPQKQTDKLLEKQSVGKPSQQISNYAELKQYFSTTEFAGHFE